MAVNVEILNWLFKHTGYTNDMSVIDVGESCAVYSTTDNIEELVYQIGGKIAKTAQNDAAIKEFSARSFQIGNPDVKTTFVSEIFSFAELDYHAIDVVVAESAQRIDLNEDSASDVTGGPFDILTNFGTTEHLINQYNAFKVFHELVRPGGYMFHLLPLVGYLNHGYFSYKPMFFEDLAKANGYEIAAMWAFGPQGIENFSILYDAYDGMTDSSLPYNAVPSWQDAQIPVGTIGALLRKVTDEPFRVSLELKTSATTE